MVVAYTVVAASVTVENMVTVTGGVSVQVPLVADGNVALGPEGERVPLRRSVVPVGLIGIEELAVGKEKPDDGAVPVGKIVVLAVGNGKLADGAVAMGKDKDEFAVGKGKLAEGAVPVGAGNVELLIGTGKLADGAVEVVFKLGTPVLKGTDTVVLVTGVDEGGARLPVRSPVGVEPENVLGPVPRGAVPIGPVPMGPVPVGPTGIEAFENAYGVVTGTAVPERLPPEDDGEKGLDVVAFVDGVGEPLGSSVKEGGPYAPLELLYRGMLVVRVPLRGKDGVGVGKGVEVGDSEPERPASVIEFVNGGEAVT